MTVRELIQKARNTLQDQEKNFWDDSELLEYYEEARRVIASKRVDKIQYQTITLTESQEYYSPSNVLRYISATDDLNNTRKLYKDDGSGLDDAQGIVIKDFDNVYVVDDSIGTTITFKYLGQPLDNNLNDQVRAGDEEACRYYMLARAYEKETDMTNFAKSDKFDFKFDTMLSTLVANASANYHEQELNTTTSYFF